MTTKTIRGRFYHGYNPFIQRPEAGLPSLSHTDLDVELQFNDHTREAALIFTKGGITYRFSPKLAKTEFEHQEIDLRFRLTAFDSDGNQLHIDLAKTFPHLIQDNDGFVYYDATKLGLNVYEEFEMGRLKAGPDGYSLMTLGEFFAKRGLNGLCHAIGFWMQFPFEAESGEFQQPLACDQLVVTTATEETLGSVQLNVAIGGQEAGIMIETSLNGSPWSLSTYYDALPAGIYALMVRQQNRPRVYFPCYFQV